MTEKAPKRPSLQDLSLSPLRRIGPVSNPQQEGETLPVTPESALEVASVEQVSGVRRWGTSAANARDRTVSQLAAVLVPVIKAAGYPTMALVLAAGIPALGVIVVALLRVGPDDPGWLVLGGLGLLVASWLAVRRRQLLAVAKDPAALAEAIGAALTGRDLREQLLRNLGSGRSAVTVARRSRPLRLLSGLWRGVALAGAVGALTDRPELAPLLPGRLRGIWLLGIAALVTSLVLGLAVLVAGGLYLLGA